MTGKYILDIYEFLVGKHYLYIFWILLLTICIGEQYFLHFILFWKKKIYKYLVIQLVWFTFLLSISHLTVI